MRLSDSRCTTGEIRSSPSFSNEMNPAIEEMIDGRREQQAVLAVEALVVGLVLDARHALAELPLPAPCQDDLPLLGDRHRKPQLLHQSFIRNHAFTESLRTLPMNGFRSFVSNRSIRFPCSTNTFAASSVVNRPTMTNNLAPDVIRVSSASGE